MRYMRARIGRAPLAALFAVLAAALVAACASPGATPPAATTAQAPTPPAAETVRTFVGTLEGTDALLGVVVDGRRALAYVCDGVPGVPVGTTPTTQAWFNGASDGRAVDVSTPDGRLVLQLTDTAMTGTLSTGGREVAVTGSAVSGDAGLYRGESESGPRSLAGWIVAADGSQRGGVGTEGGVRLGTVKLDPRLTTTLPLTNSALLRIAKVGITPIPIP